MEDQGKRLLLAVGLAFGIMLAWQFLFPQQTAKEPPPTAPTTASAPANPATPQAAASPPLAQAPVARGPEALVELGGPRFRAVFTSHGGALKSWQLLGEQFEDRKRKAPEDLVRSKREALLPFQVGFVGGPAAWPAETEWQIVSKTATEVVFAREQGGLKVVKTFTLYPADYLIKLEVDVVSSAPVRQSLVVSLGSFQDPAEVTKGRLGGQIGREWKAACDVDGAVKTWSAKTLSGTSKEAGGQVAWFGFVYPYFLAGVAIEPRDERVTCRVSGPTGADGVVGAMLAEAAFQPADLAPGTTYSRSMAGYFGPKYMGQLDAVGAVLGWPEKSVGFEDTIDLGWLWFLAGPLLWLLSFFHGLVGNWPLSIVLLTLTVKAITLPWTHKSMKSMKGMAKLKPHLEALKDKYKDDRQRQQVETMNLFKEHGVNPMAGCLPMILQMPIWFALYRSLSVAAELYQAPFLWIHDLTAADPYFVLPVFMTAMMLAQSMMTPATASGTQQKVMQYGLPIIFGAMSLFFPAGLTLYISTNSILTLLHHLYLRREDRAAAAGAAGVGRVIDVVDTIADGDGDDRSSGGTNGASGGKKRPKGRGGRRRGAHS